METVASEREPGIKTFPKKIKINNDWLWRTLKGKAQREEAGSFDFRPPFTGNTSFPSHYEQVGNTDRVFHVLFTLLFQ